MNRTGEWNNSTSIALPIYRKVCILLFLDFYGGSFLYRYHLCGSRKVVIITSPTSRKLNINISSSCCFLLITGGRVRTTRLMDCIGFTIFVAIFLLKYFFVFCSPGAADCYRYLKLKFLLSFFENHLTILTILTIAF